jgi:Kdo2-lipid IVA lauroyltransferase/acyltransferase
MKILKYFVEFIIISILFLIFKILGYRLSSNLGGFIGQIFGPLLRSKKTIYKNLKKAFPLINDNEIKKISKNMWSNYGRIFSDYMYLKNFRSSKLDKYLIFNGKKKLEKINDDKKPVIFISGHFNNFELMAMQIEKSDVSLAAIYRPLNNIFINKIIEPLRKKYICKKQIKKGIPGLREMLKLYKEGYSVAMMIDQRVSEGIKSNLFNVPALTTTIPAQMIKKFNCKIVPVYTKRIDKFYYEINIEEPLSISSDQTIQEITDNLNLCLENMIKKNPDQWIWSHNRWK